MDDLDYDKLFSIGFANLFFLIRLLIFPGWIFSIFVFNRSEAYFHQTPAIFLGYLACWFILNLLETISRWFLHKAPPGLELLKAWGCSLPMLLMALGTFAVPQLRLWFFLLGLASLLTMYGARHSSLEKLPLKSLFIYLSCLLVSVIFNPLSQQLGCCVTSEKISSVKANMFTLQAIVETYKEAHGRYPRSLRELRVSAMKPGQEYWKEFTDPFSGASGYDRAYMDTGFDALPLFIDVLGIRLYNPKLDPELAGMVLYRNLAPTQYRIYGLNKLGQSVRQKGQNFIQSN